MGQIVKPSVGGAREGPCGVRARLRMRDERLRLSLMCVLQGSIWYLWKWRLPQPVRPATTTYGYDYANRLTFIFAGGTTTTYGYDAFGQRVTQTGISTTHLY